MLTNIRLSQVQLFKKLQAAGFLDSMIGELGKKANFLAKFTVLIAKNLLPQLVTNETLSVIDKFKKTIVIR